ncbi:sterile alpha motif domain-containing protein 1-like [Kogia breviceps]|uniref:sterile alpha motif domain-containing protein 1-like n=1 Tax=Kogia breviceps TaxID=27615 RepID=UPI0034D22B97
MERRALLSAARTSSVSECSVSEQTPLEPENGGCPRSLPFPHVSGISVPPVVGVQSWARAVLDAATWSGGRGTAGGAEPRASRVASILESLAPGSGLQGARALGSPRWTGSRRPLQPQPSSTPPRGRGGGSSSLPGTPGPDGPFPPADRARRRGRREKEPLRPPPPTRCAQGSARRGQLPSPLPLSCSPSLRPAQAPPASRLGQQSGVRVRCAALKRNPRPGPDPGSALPGGGEALASSLFSAAEL